MEHFTNIKLFTFQQTWYQPTFDIIAGKKKRIAKLPKGCLYDRNYNYKSGTDPSKFEGVENTPQSDSHKFSDADCKS